MCGISGIVAEKIDVGLLWKMTETVKYRGPDDEGYVLFSPDGPCFAHGEDTAEEIKASTAGIGEAGGPYYLGLGHRRLNILDLSPAGHQPMCDDEQNVFITYNGELFNYLELREELKQKGYSFHSGCDTEVILNAYKEWKEDCVKKFNGMWAFAIWDVRNKTLFASRDRFGVKPFYYYRGENKFLFGSEIKQILQDGSIPREGNESKIFHYLYNYGDSSEETFFRHIFELKGSHSLRLRLGCDHRAADFRIYRYWNLSEKPNPRSYEENRRTFSQLFESSIGLRLRSDVKLGGCLSGGLDSSSIVCTLGKKFGHIVRIKDFETFTAAYNGGSADEREYSSQVVQSVGCRENQVFPTCGELKNEIGRLIWHQDEPFGSLSLFAQWCVMKSAKAKKVKVLLDGQGGDEILLGYVNYYAAFLKKRWKEGNFLKLLAEIRKASENSDLSYPQLMRYCLYFNCPFLRNLRLKRKAKQLLNPSFLKKHSGRDDVRRIAAQSVFGTIFELQKSEIMDCNLPGLLRFEDRNSMAFSIESRVPFLDYRLVEFAANLADTCKIRDGWTKALLRDSMKGILPDKIRLRKNKLGFETPQADWLEEREQDIRELFLRKDRKSANYIDRDKLFRLLGNLNRNHAAVWRAVCLELWMQIYHVG